MSSHGWVYVDDADPSIVYSGGDWITSARSGPSSVSGVFDGTLHGAQTEGITATFKFTGSEVGVIGTSGWTDKYGWPAVDFSIDGVQQDTSTFPPGISATTLFTNVTFFDSPVSPEAHILTITNLNGTAPNTFWFDYIFYRPLVGEGGGGATLGGSASTETGAGATSSTSGHLTSTAAMIPSALTESGRSSAPTRGALTASTDGAAQTSRSEASGISGMSGSTAGSSSSNSVESSPSGSSGLRNGSSTSPKNHAGPIVGGVVGGILFVILSAVVAYVVFRRRLRAWYGIGEIVPAGPLGGEGAERRVTILPAEGPGPGVAVAPREEVLTAAS